MPQDISNDEDPFEGKPFKRAVTGPGRFVKTFSAKITRGPGGLKEARKKNPESFLTEDEEEFLQGPGFLQTMFDKKKKK